MQNFVSNGNTKANFTQNEYGIKDHNENFLTIENLHLLVQLTGVTKKKKKKKKIKGQNPAAKNISEQKGNVWRTQGL